MHITVTHLLQHNGRAAREQADALIALATEKDLQFWLVMAQMLRATSVLEESIESDIGDEVRDSIAQVRQTIDIYCSLGARLDVMPCLVALARGHLTLGQTEEGLNVLLEAREEIDRTGQRYYAAEVFRVRGELLHAQTHGGISPLAEDSFYQSLAIARAQDAKLLELRAAASLGQMLRDWGRPDEARQIIAPFYTSFAERSPTLDVQQVDLHLKP